MTFDCVNKHYVYSSVLFSKFYVASRPHSLNGVIAIYVAFNLILRTPNPIVLLQLPFQGHLTLIRMKTTISHVSLK